ncbi:MAG TPA: hypothetical protein VJ901_17685 [Thermoanaerobaculia bacterium]|nr:hypothetical protein [Thermoanaerobaculia bacterium]
MRKEHGYSLADMLVVLAIIGMSVGVALPSFNSLRRRSAVRTAATEIRAMFQEARMRAITSRNYSGFRFSKTGNEWRYAEYIDGNRNGLRNEDIVSGIDYPLFPPRPVLMLDRGAATIGVLAKTVPDPDGDKLISTSSAVQFGRSQICSFSPMGECTSGTIYLIDGLGGIYAVRAYGASAKIRTLRYDDKRRRWEQL